MALPDLSWHRYTSKAALHDVHQKSEPFGSFKATMEKLDLFESKEGALASALLLRALQSSPQLRCSRVRLPANPGGPLKSSGSGLPSQDLELLRRAWDTWPRPLAEARSGHMLRAVHSRPLACDPVTRSKRSALLAPLSRLGTRFTDCHGTVG